jgi:hypothetical protein
LKWGDHSALTIILSKIILPKIWAEWSPRLIKEINLPKIEQLDLFRELKRSFCLGRMISQVDQKDQSAQILADWSLLWIEETILFKNRQNKSVLREQTSLHEHNLWQ